MDATMPRPFAVNAAPGFGDPLGVPRACHRRIERRSSR
jgi:hypothetical protein